MLSKNRTSVAVGLALFYLLAWCAGWFFTYCGLVQPDTCWILKLGQIIVQAGAIPRADPFTFTWTLLSLSGSAPPYVVYQWLSEVVFYLAFIVGSFKAMLALGAIISVLTYLALPWRICLNERVSKIWSFFAVLFLMFTVVQRFQVRPEIFTCLFLSILLAVLQKIRQLDAAEHASAGKVNWRLVSVQTILMVCWCNFHTGFIAGIIVSAFYAGAFALQEKMAKQKFSPATKTFLAGLGLSLVGTLINPYGLGIWTYLPHLFFSPINALIPELNPLALGRLFAPKNLPFVALLLCCYGGLIFGFIKHSAQAKAIIDSPKLVASLLMIQIAALLPFCCSRLISIAAIIMVCECAHTIGSLNNSPMTKDAFWSRKISWLCLEGLMLLVSVAAVYHYAGNELPIRLPEATHFFTPPVDAMKAFAKIYKGGRIFSCAEVGDMIDLYISPRKAIFLDTRYDIFNSKILDQHKNILLAQPGWKELLEYYTIDWVFAQKQENICAQLVKDPDWMALYSDDQATIFRRLPRLRLKAQP